MCIHTHTHTHTNAHTHIGTIGVVNPVTSAENFAILGVAEVISLLY